MERKAENMQKLLMFLKNKKERRDGAMVIEEKINKNESVHTVDPNKEQINNDISEIK